MAIELDPDARGQQAIRLVLQKFDELGRPAKCCCGSAASAPVTRGGKTERHTGRALARVNSCNARSVHRSTCQRRRKRDDRPQETRTTLPVATIMIESCAYAGVHGSFGQQVLLCNILQRRLDNGTATDFDRPAPRSISQGKPRSAAVGRRLGRLRRPMLCPLSYGRVEKLSHGASTS